MDFVGIGSTPHRAKMGFWSYAVWVLTALLVLIVGGICWAMLRQHSTAPSPFQQAQRMVSFPLYYPKGAPSSLKFVAKSVTHTADVVLYSYTYADDKKLSISIQPITPDFDVDTFRPTSEFTTHIGRAYLVDTDDRSSAAVVGKKSWVLINAPDKIAVDTMKDFINSLTPVR